MVTRWSRSTSTFYALIGRNLTGEFMLRIYAASGNLFTDSWSWQSFLSSCDALKRLFPLDVQNKIQLLSRFSVIRVWFVYWVFGWEMRRLSKSLEILFWIASCSPRLCVRLCTNGRTNSQHCCVRVGSGVQTDAITANWHVTRFVSFGCTYKAINSMSDFFHSWTVCQLFFFKMI